MSAPLQKHETNNVPYGISNEQFTVLISAIREGAFFATACRIAGVKYDTFGDWMVRGGDAASTAKDKPAPGEEREPYASFVKAVRQAEAESELYAQRKLNAGMDADWRAAAHVLKIRHADRWADKSQGVQVNTTGSVQFFLPDNQRDALTEESSTGATTEFSG